MNVLDALKAKRVTDLHKVWIDLDNNKATFPLFATDGRFVGFQTYSPDLPKNGKVPKNTRYFTWASEPALWGLDTVPQDAKVVFVTEAIFRAAALHSVDVPAVSILGSCLPKPLLRLINTSDIKFVWIGDPDKAGAELINKFKHGGVQSPKDLDEMTHDELLAFKTDLINKFGV